MAHKNKTNRSPYKDRQKQKTLAGSAKSPAEKASSQPGVPKALPLKGRHKSPERIYSLEEANDRLLDLFRNHDFGDVTHAERRQLAHFYVLLMEQQKTLNVTRLITLKDVGLKHFVDCLMVPRLVTLQFPLLDMGTGPGFPGIPLKIKFPADKIILAEGVQKRVEFLKKVREELKLQNLPIIGRNIDPWFFYPVRGVITRAVEDVGNTLSRVLFCLEKGGCVYLMKGPGVDPEIETAASQWSRYYSLEQNIAYTLPKTELQRRLVVYRKIENAPFPDLEDEPWPEGED